MLSPNLTVKDAAAADQVFNLISNQGTTVIRRDVTTSRQVPSDLTIAHSENKNRLGQITDRHLVQQQITLPVTDVGKRLVTTNLTFAIDRDVDPSDAAAAVLDHVRQLCFLMLGSTFDSTDFTNNDFVEAILRGES